MYAFLLLPFLATSTTSPPFQSYYSVSVCLSVCHRLPKWDKYSMFTKYCLHRYSYVSTCLSVCLLAVAIPLLGTLFFDPKSTMYFDIVGWV